MPQILASGSAKMIALYDSDEDVRAAVLQSLRTAADFGFNHGKTEFVQALCDDLRALADAEADPRRKKLLLAAAEVVCVVAAELMAEASAGITTR